MLAIEKYNAKVRGRLSNDSPVEDMHLATKDIREEIENE